MRSGALLQPWREEEEEEGGGGGGGGGGGDFDAQATRRRRRRRMRPTTLKESTLELAKRVNDMQTRIKGTTLVTTLFWSAAAGRAG